jgi:hypothetical protein
MKNPCYDSINKIDCANRCAGCSTNCEKWKKYEEDRNKKYAEYSNEFRVNGYEIDRRIRAEKFAKSHNYYKYSGPK